MVMSWKYSITLSSFKDLEPIQKTLENLKHQGFDAVEVYGEPDLIDVGNISHLLDSLSMNVSGVTGMWGFSSSEYKCRNLVTNNNHTLIAAQNYVKKCILLCHTLGGNTFNLCLFSDKPLILNGNHKNLLRDERRRLLSSLIEPLRELLIEPLNRYSTPICSDCEDAKYIAELVDQENVGIMLDTFHMNIEEDSIYDAIINSHAMLKHVHLSDNNRKMPGFAHIDFEGIIRALKKIKYSKFITFEPIIQSTDYKSDIKLGLQYVENLSKK
jgi:sugar phosphate isomerase/epimerase